MPHLAKLLKAHGTTFRNYVTTSPQCCPSRASLLTGQYPHNSGVLANRPGYSDLTHPADVLPVWLQEVGYKTAHIGKFLHGYVEPAAPPGWDEWFSRTDASFHPYYNYDLSENGTIAHYGVKPRDYSGRIFMRAARAIVEEYLPRPTPLYLQIDFSAPHIGAGVREPCNARTAVPDPRDRGAFSDARSPTPPSLNERDVSDKPAFVRSLPPLSPPEVRTAASSYRCELASLLSIDRAVRTVWRAVMDAGELNNTVFVYVSDNGALRGEHRLREGKVVPYEEAVRVPLVIRLPGARRDGAPRTRATSLPVANIDLAPTIVQLAGACKPLAGCRTMDGRSLLPILRGRQAHGFDGRSLLIEWWENRGGEQGICRYAAVRRTSAIYIHYVRVANRASRCVPVLDDVEMYDLNRDPYQLDNLAPAASGTKAASRERRFRRVLADLRNCSGIEARDPQPSTGQYCD